MGNETTYSGVWGMLGRLITALGASAMDLAHLDGARLRLAEIMGDATGIAQQAVFTASEQGASRKFRGLLLEGPHLANGTNEFLQEPYGTRLEKLTKLGLQPFRGGRQPKAVDQPVGS